MQIDSVDRQLSARSTQHAKNKPAHLRKFRLEDQTFPSLTRVRQEKDADASSNDLSFQYSNIVQENDEPDQSLSEMDAAQQSVIEDSSEGLPLNGEIYREIESTPELIMSLSPTLSEVDISVIEQQSWNDQVVEREMPAFEILERFLAQRRAIDELDEKSTSDQWELPSTDKPGGDIAVEFEESTHVEDGEVSSFVEPTSEDSWLLFSPNTPRPKETPVNDPGERLSVEQQLWDKATTHMEKTAPTDPWELLENKQQAWSKPTSHMEVVTVQPQQDFAMAATLLQTPITLDPVTPEGIVIPSRAIDPITPKGLVIPRQKQGAGAVLFPWIYRGWLLCATILLTILLLRFQSILDRIPSHASIWQTSVRWAELSWLAPVPLAIILWLGWFIFAEAAQPSPLPAEVPTIPSKRGLYTFTPAKSARLVFRFVTRGDNVEVLRDSVIAVHQAFARYPLATGPYRIEIISECPVYLNMGIDERTRIYVVPPEYATQKHSRFKARALTYLQEHVAPQREDWYVYLDEESLIDEKMLAGLYRFVHTSLEQEARAEKDQKKRSATKLIGQGAILYQGGNWFFRGADALRTADDLGRFRFQYALGLPMFGVHGSFIVIRSLDDNLLSFDVGFANSITEDAAWALRAWSKGFRFTWVEGYLHEQPPQKVKDFVRQRSRWLSGIRAVLRDKETPLPYRVCLGVFTGLWQLAFLPFMVAVIALFVHASPFLWMRIPADFAWATFILAYLQGIDIQARHSHPFIKRKPGEVQWKRAVSWLLVLCSIWYSLLEAAGVLYSLRPKQGFFVIQKPSLAAENKFIVPQQPYQPATRVIVGERQG